jgi:predicted HD superfamily hydrolase involved in NAD metabolism
MHDLAREMREEEMRFWTSRLSPEEKLLEADLLHGPVASLMLKDRGIGDEEVWEAISAHTTGAPGMGLLALVLYVADHAEPARISPGAEVARRLAFHDLRAAAIVLLEEAIRYLETRGRPVHLRSREALKWLRQGSPRGWEASAAER